MVGQRFSRRTAIAAVEMLEDRIKTHHELTRYLLRLATTIAAECTCAGATLADRFNRLIVLFDQNPHLRTDEGKFLLDEIVEKAVSLLPAGYGDDDEYLPWPADPLQPIPAAFVRSLGRDGFTVKGGALRRTLPAELHLPEAEDEITRLLTKHGFSTPKEHLRQAFDNHSKGNAWASANSQIRTFLEGLMDEIAERIDPTAAALPSGHGRRAKLAKAGFLSRSLNEWDDGGSKPEQGFIVGLVSRLHPAGAHPGLSDQDDCTFRLHTVLITARLLLDRFDRWPTP